MVRFETVLETETRAQIFHTDVTWVVLLIGRAACEICFPPIRSTTLGSTRHQCGISALVSQTSSRGETSSGVAKCRLFSAQASYYTVTPPPPPQKKKEIWQQELYRLIPNPVDLYTQLFLSIANTKFHV